MKKLIKQIRKILGNNYTNQITIHILADEIYIGIYENEVPIIIDLKGRQVYIECEGLKGSLCGDTLSELVSIIEVLEDNLYVLESLLDWD